MQNVTDVDDPLLERAERDGEDWRDLAVEDSQNAQSPGLHYTMVQSMSAADFEALKALVVEFIAQTKKIADPSAPEVFTALNIDFFRPRD